MFKIKLSAGWFHSRPLLGRRPPSGCVLSCAHACGLSLWPILLLGGHQSDLMRVHSNNLGLRGPAL